MKLQPRYFFMALLTALVVIRAVYGKPIEVPSHIENLIGENIQRINDGRATIQKAIPVRVSRPDVLQIIIRSLRNDETTENYPANVTESRQIPIISDIERFRKIAEILEFVGDRVGDILENIQAAPVDQ